MAIFQDIVEWYDETGKTMVHREPQSGARDFITGTHVIVQESQAAVFFRDGKALDTLKAGRHQISTKNIPFLTALLSLPTGFKSPFKSSIVYVNLKSFLNMKWGTKEPITMRDSELKMVRLRAFGKFATKIVNPQLFVQEVCGSAGKYTTDGVEEYFKDQIVSRLTDVLGETLKTIFDLPAHFDEIGGLTKARVADDFLKYGIEISDFKFAPSNVSVPIGARVTWINRDSAPHDATANESNWKTGTMDKGDSITIEFAEPGTFEYHCSIHPYMRGVITVRAAD